MTDKLRHYVESRYRLLPNVPYFGIELEVENAGIPTGIEDSRWTTVEDGSLRNNGMEFLSTTPMTTDQVTDGVELFYEWKEMYRYTTSVRTSTHVHVNVLDFSLEQIAAMCVVYTLVEPLLFRYCGPDREENIYCVPWYRASDELDFVRVLGEGSMADVSCSCKYSALYLEPLRRFGTLEFRQAPVFDHSGELLDWIEMCHSIVYSGYGSPAEVLRAYSSGHPLEFIESTFGPHLTTVLRQACDMDIADLLEEYDVYTTAELALACTYKPTGWFIPQVLNPSGISDGTSGYHLQHPMRPPGYRNVGTRISDLLELRMTADEVLEEFQEYDEDYPEEYDEE